MRSPFHGPHLVRLLARPKPHLRLRLDAQSIHDPVAVIEIANRLYGVENCFIVETGDPQIFDIAAPQIHRRHSHLDRIIEQGPRCGVQIDSPIVILDCANLRFVLDLRPEIAFVALDSVKASVGPRYDRRDQDPLQSR